MEKHPDLRAQGRQHPLPEGAEGVQGDAGLGVIQAAVLLRQGEGLPGQLRQQGAGLPVVLHLPNLLLAHVDDH